MPLINSESSFQSIVNKKGLVDPGITIQQWMATEILCAIVGDSSRELWEPDKAVNTAVMLSNYLIKELNKIS
jgi:hypothetical protein